MKKHLLLAIAFCALSPFAWAQTNNVPYTLQNETDPMALGSAPAVIQDEALPATPPPGSDNFRQNNFQHDSTDDSAPATTGGVPAVIGDGQPTSIIPPYPALSRDLEETPRALKEYPNNPVSAVMPENTTKFENRVICTFEIAFGSIGRRGPDKKTGDAVKSYLDGQADKIQTIRKERGNNGEYSYCVIVQQHNNRARIYGDLKRTILTQKGTIGPVSLTGEGFEPVGGHRSKVPHTN